MNLSLQPAIVSARYETFVDQAGAEHIDLTGGFGYQELTVVHAVDQQAKRMGLSNRVLISAPLLNFCSTLAQVLPKPLDMSYVCNSGDEAFEGALKLCKGLKPQGQTLVYITGGDYGSLTYGRCLSHPERYPEMIEFLGMRLIGIQNIQQLKAISPRGGLLCGVLYTADNRCRGSDSYSGCSSCQSLESICQASQSPGDLYGFTHSIGSYGQDVWL